MSSPVSYTIYNPEKLLSEQLEKFAETTYVNAQVLGKSLKASFVEFKTLKVNKILLDISVTVSFDLTLSVEGSSLSLVTYEKRKFSVKSKETNEIHLEEISSEDIEATIKKIYESSAQQSPKKAWRRISAKKI